MTEEEKYAYRQILYHAMLEIRACCWGNGGGGGVEAGDGTPDCSCLELAEWTHNLARFSAVNFEGFKTETFWSEHNRICLPHPKLAKFRTIFEEDRKRAEKRERTGRRKAGILAIAAAMALYPLPQALGEKTEGEHGAAGFTSLRDAVLFVSECVVAEDVDRFERAVASSEGRDEVRLGGSHILKQLKDINQLTPLTTLYEGREFPREEDHFTLGGHDSELDHTHIVFKKVKGSWLLWNLYICR